MRLIIDQYQWTGWRQKRFPREILVDILCYLQLFKELAIQAKGQILLMEAGIKLPPDKMLEAKLKELKFLENSIGQTGLIAIMPFLKTTTQDIWQVFYLQKQMK